MILLFHSIKNDVFIFVKRIVVCLSIPLQSVCEWGGGGRINLSNVSLINLHGFLKSKYLERYFLLYLKKSGNLNASLSYVNPFISKVIRGPVFSARLNANYSSKNPAAQIVHRFRDPIIQNEYDRTERNPFKEKILS